MTKPNRALKVIDKNSLPKIIDILEIPKAKDSKSLKETSKSELSGENDGSIPNRPRKRRRKPLALSKTPKISNLGGNKNVTTRRGLLAKYNRPPMPNPIGSATKKRKGLGSTTPYGAQMARLRGRSGGITPSLSKSPNLKKHYDRLRPIACNLYNQHTKEQQEAKTSKKHLGSIAGRNGHDQKTTINCTPSMKATHNPVNRKPPTTPSKKRSDEKKTNPPQNPNEHKSIDQNEDKNQSDSDDMDCNSSDESQPLISTSSSSLSSEPKKPYLSSSNGNQSGRSPQNQNQFDQRIGWQNQMVKKYSQNEPHAKSSPSLVYATTNHLSDYISPSNENKDEEDGNLEGGTQPEATCSSSNHTTSIEDVEVFNLVMGKQERSKVDNELLGATIGGSRFYWNHIDEDSILTSVSSIGNQKSTTILSAEKSKRVALQTPIGELRHTNSSPPVDDQNRQQGVSPKQHYQSNEPLEEESIESWSIDGHRNSPIFFWVGGKKYGHPALPPGWTMRVSRGQNQPTYSHPDHGRTWYCPINLTPNMLYVRGSDGRYVRQPKSHRESLKTDSNLPKRVHHRRETPKTPPSARELIPFQSRSRHLISQANKTKDSDRPESQQEDQDSTFELMKEISVLSARLMKKSSSNLQKVENVKTIHKNTSHLSNYDISSGTEAVQSDTKRQRLLSSADSRSNILCSTTSRSTSSQHLEQETPSTMSAVLQQYERELGRYNNLTNGSQSYPNSSKKNGATSILASVREEKQMSPIMESNDSEYIEAWYTPAEDIMKGDSIAQTALLGFGSQKKDSLHILKTKEKSPTNGKPYTVTNVEANSNSKVAKSIKKSVKESPIQYDDEWSPLTQPKSVSRTSDKAITDGPAVEVLSATAKQSSTPYDDEWSPFAQANHTFNEDDSKNRQADYESSPESPLRHDRKPSGVTEIQKNPITTIEPEKEAKPGVSNESDELDVRQRFQMQSKDDTVLPVLDANTTASTHKKLESRMSKEDSKTHFDTESLDTLSTESNSKPQGEERRRIHDSISNDPQVSTITIAVQAHRTKEKSPKVVDVGVAVPLKRKGELFCEDQSSGASEEILSGACDRSNNSRVEVLEDGNSDIYSNKDGSTLSGETQHPSNVAHPTSDASQTESEDEQSVSNLASIARVDKNEDSKHSRGTDSDKADTSDDDFVDNVEIHDGANWTNVSFDLVDDNSDADTYTSEQVEQTGSPDADRNVRDRNSSPLVSRDASPPLSDSIEDEITSSGAESATESPVKPITLNQDDSHSFPDIENSDSSIESPDESTKFDSKQNSVGNSNSSFIPRKQNGMSWRVLNPPHPLCSLQRLEELISLESKRKKSRAQRPRKGGRAKRNKISVARRRKAKGGARN